MESVELDDITRIALALDDLGLPIDFENLIRYQSVQPLEAFAYDDTLRYSP
jgi:hypothetical protein